MGSTPATGTRVIDTVVHHGIPLHVVSRSQDRRFDTGPPICTGTLTFAVGTQDEPLAMLGITHLVEHMILGKLERLPIPHGAMVDHESVQFHATGAPADVASFLAAVAHAITNFSRTTHRDLALAKRVVNAENPHAYTRFSSGMLTYRFGARGPGLAHLQAPTLDAITTPEATAWAARWLTARNAALSFTAPAPEGLNVLLPAGDLLPRPDHVPVLDAPTLIASPLQGIALSLLVPAHQVLLLASALEHELGLALRSEKGLVYSVDSLVYPLRNAPGAGRHTHNTPDTTPNAAAAPADVPLPAGSLCQLDLVLDPLHQNTLRVLTKSVRLLRLIAAQGFGADAITHAGIVHMATLGIDTPVSSEYLDQFTADQLAGRTTPTPHDPRPRPHGSSGSELAQVLSDALPTLLLAVDDDVKISARKAASLGLERDKFTLWRRSSTGGQGTVTVFNLEGPDEAASWVHRRAKEKLTLTGTHLVKKKPTKTWFIELATIKLVGVRGCGCICLIDARGRHTELDTAEFKQSKSLRQALLDTFDKNIIRDFPGF